SNQSTSLSDKFGLPYNILYYFVSSTSNSLSHLLEADESRKPDYTVFCISKDNPSLEFAALFSEGAKPVKKDELKYQLDKERLQSITKLYFDYILVHILSLYRKFLTREISKEILAISLITMQATVETIKYPRNKNETILTQESNYYYSP
ncbi:14994_t:CDS:2, partial [Dentiscutata heterogama]